MLYVVSLCNARGEIIKREFKVKEEDLVGWLLMDNDEIEEFEDQSADVEHLAYQLQAHRLDVKHLVPGLFAGTDAITLIDDECMVAVAKTPELAKVSMFDQLNIWI